VKRNLTFIGLISLILIIGLAFTACGEGRNSPSGVVRQLHTAIENGDTNAINDLMVPEAAELVNKMASELRSKLTESGGIASMEQTISGDTAVVRVTYRDGETDDFDLIRIGGRWRVTIDFSNK